MKIDFKNHLYTMLTCILFVAAFAVIWLVVKLVGIIIPFFLALYFIFYQIVKEMRRASSLRRTVK